MTTKLVGAIAELIRHLQYVLLLLWHFIWIALDCDHIVTVIFQKVGPCTGSTEQLSRLVYLKLLLLHLMLLLLVDVLLLVMLLLVMRWGAVIEEGGTFR